MRLSGGESEPGPGWTFELPKHMNGKTIPFAAKFAWEEENTYEEVRGEFSLAHLAELYEHIGSLLGES